MDDILELMELDERCCECGALLCGRSDCAHCGHEPEAAGALATVVPIAAPADSGRPAVEPIWLPEPRVA